MSGNTGNSIYGYSAGGTSSSIYGGNTNGEFLNICTNTLTAGEINVGNCTDEPLYTLPTIAPPTGLPGSRVVMTAHTGSTAFVIPNSTFQWLIGTTNGNFYPVNVVVAAGEYDITTDIFPLIEAEFQAVLAPITASGDFVCSMNGDYFNLTLTNANLINLVRQYDDGVAPSNYYLGSQTGQSEIYTNGTIQPPQIVVLSATSDAVMQWEPYSLVDVPAVQNPMDSNLDANDYNIKNLSGLNLTEQLIVSTPPLNSISLFAEASGSLSVIDDAGVTSILRQNVLQSLDSSATIVGNTGSILSFSAASCDFGTSTAMTVTPTVNANVGGLIDFTAGTSHIKLKNATPYVSQEVGAVVRYALTNALSGLYAPAGISGLTITDAASTFLNGATVTGTGPLEFPSLDRVGAISLGSVNATGITMGHGTINIALTGNLTINSRPVNTGMITFIGNDNVNSTAVETSILQFATGSFIIPANTILAGSQYAFNFGGNISVTTALLRFRVRGTVGGITGALLYDSGNLVTAVGDWNLRGSILFRTVGAAGVASCNSTTVFNNTSTSAVTDYQNTATIDTTINNTISVTAQWSNAASNMNRRTGYFGQTYV